MRKDFAYQRFTNTEPAIVLWLFLQR